MQLAATSAPVRLDIPTRVQQALDAAVHEGRAQAHEWSASNPNATPAEFDQATLESVAPVPTGVDQQADLELVREAMASRTELQDARADQLARTSAKDVWFATIEHIGRQQGPEQARRAAELVLDSRSRNGEVTSTAKWGHARQRPYQVDSSISTVVPRPDDNPSYPSGHASGAYAAALVLGALVPERAAELREMADQVAYSRVYGGVHFASDVAAGARVGARIASDVLRRAGIVSEAATATAAAATAA